MVETVSDFVFWGSRVAADGDCSHEVGHACSMGGGLQPAWISCLGAGALLCRRGVCLVKAVVFPVVVCGCEGWTVKRVEH